MKAPLAAVPLRPRHLALAAAAALFSGGAAAAAAAADTRVWTLRDPWLPYPDPGAVFHAGGGGGGGGGGGSSSFYVTAYGAVADNQTSATLAIRRAFAACSRAGGGYVVVPRGVFRTGKVT